MADDGALLDDLDEILVEIRKVAQRPGYRRRLLDGIDVPGGPATIRALRAIERLSHRTPSVGDLSEALALDPSTTSRVVDRCVRGGLLTRELHPDDRRRTQLRLTSEGSDLLDATSRSRRALLAEVTDGWATEDLRHLVELLGVLGEGFDRLESTQ